MTSVAETLSIEDMPSPKGLPVVGNMFDVPAAHTITSLMPLVRELGPMIRLRTPIGDRFIASGLPMIDDLCDDERFDKLVTGGQSTIRQFGSSTGLFTSDTDDPNWGKAHNILLPNFSMQAMRDYVPMMNDIASQLMQKWERLNPGESVDVTADMTRLTLDTIALCGFGYRFNSFYRDTQHPFVEAMMVTLLESQARSREIPIQTKLRRGAEKRVIESFRYMESEVHKILDERRRSGDIDGRKDLLSCMLTGVDKATGERLSDENIVAQCITFLIAGHETTSGLLSFAVYFLMKTPDVAARAQEEVNRVLGTDTSVLPTDKQLQSLTYVTQILNETLRLYPTAPAFTRQPRHDDVVGGYRMPKGAAITALTIMLHRDPSIWGEDADDFNPDHFTPETRSALPTNAFKPFGSGQRACIGRQFAMQEAVLVLAMLVQRFDFVDHLDYQLKIKESLTIKPDGLSIQVRLRPGRTTGAVPVRAAAATTPAESEQREPRPRRTGEGHNTPLTVLFGSNLGTAEGVANKIAQDGSDRGYAVTLGTLDDHIGLLPHEGALVVVCASYNGKPPDNAERFCRWLSDPTAPADAAAGLAFSVFGCGNMDWASTYQAVPTLLDAQLAAHGGVRVRDRGEGDARADFDGQFSEWYSGLWPALTEQLGLSGESSTVTSTEPRLQMTMTNRQTTNPVVVSYRAQPSLLLVNRELLDGNGDAGARSARHLELQLSGEVEYAAGDHLGVMPRNHVDLIRRVMARFGLDAGTYLTITPTAGAFTHLPLDEPTPLLGVLGSCVELQDVATRTDLATLARYATDAQEAAELATLSGLDEEGKVGYRDRVAAPRASVLDLLDRYPSVDLPFYVFLELLPPMRPRYYSISSSPAAGSACHLTVGVVRGPARSGRGEFSGVASGHLADSMEGSTVFTFVRKPTIPFHPPANPHVPLIMVGAGTGLAPFRGFLQERAALQVQGVPVGKSIMFFGCRDPQRDFLYADELKAFVDAGVTDLQVAFSRAEGQPRTYVQDLIEGNQDQVWDLIAAGAVIFVCGNAHTMAPGVRSALTAIHQAKTGGSPSAAADWLADLKAADRFLEDIWGETTAGL